MSENPTPTTQDPPARLAVPRVVEAIDNEPWAITEEWLATIRSIATRENEVSQEALEAVQAKRAANTFGLQIREGVAILNVTGPVMRYADIFAMISGATSYEALRKDLETAMRDPNVRGILFSFDSPGGMVNGCAEMAAAIRAAGAIKPVEAYVGGSACSAAYWMASACNRITIDPTAHVGSIGVVFSLRDTSERDARSGVKTVEFVSSRAPNKRLAYDSDAGKAKLQKWADSLEDVFISAVASNRGVTEEDVATNFGGGGIEVGSDAVRIGMADALGSFEEVFARLRNGNGQKARKKEVEPMSEAKTYSQAEFDAAVAKAKGDGAAEANAASQTATADAGTAATNRIKAIMEAPEAQKRPALAKHLAFNTTQSADEAVALMKVSAEEPGQGSTTTASTDQRSKDAAGGLALDTLDKGKTKADEDDKKPKPAAIDTAGIYKRRAETLKSA